MRLYINMRLPVLFIQLKVAEGIIQRLGISKLIRMHAKSAFYNGFFAKVLSF